MQALLQLRNEALLLRCRGVRGAMEPVQQDAAVVPGGVI